MVNTLIKIDGKDELQIEKVERKTYTKIEMEQKRDAAQQKVDYWQSKIDEFDGLVAG